MRDSAEFSQPPSSGHLAPPADTSRSSSASFFCLAGQRMDAPTFRAGQAVENAQFVPGDEADTGGYCR